MTNKNKNNDNELDPEGSNFFKEEVEERDWDSLSDRICDKCGVRLNKEEFREFEDFCSDCAWEDTSGLSEEQPDED